MSDGLVQDEGKRSQYYGIILGELGRLQYMVGEMLDMSKIQSGSVHFFKRPVEARNVFSGVIEKYMVLYDELGIDFRMNFDLEHCPQLKTDATGAAQVMEILLDNASKFVDEGGWIELSSTTKFRRIVFCVRDNGIGIAKPEQKDIFRRFYKCDLPRNTSGNGLGLAIAKAILDALGEKIWVESDSGQGAAFYFSIQKADSSISK